MRESVKSFYQALREASPGDCRNLFNALEETKIRNPSPLVTQLQKVLLLYGVMKEDPYKDDLRKGDYSKVNVNIKVEKDGDKFTYYLVGREAKDKIAAFPGFLQAALVTRYLSGGNMRPEDAENALRAIAEYDIETGAD